jgi:hypothetical protein
VVGLGSHLTDLTLPHVCVRLKPGHEDFHLYMAWADIEIIQKSEMKENYYGKKV